MAYKGNRALDNVSYLLKEYREIVPPILHFTSPEKGVFVFNGLCALQKIENENFYLEDNDIIYVFFVFFGVVGCNFGKSRY